MQGKNCEVSSSTMIAYLNVDSQTDKGLSAGQMTRNNYSSSVVCIIASITCLHELSYQNGINPRKIEQK